MKHLLALKAFLFILFIGCVLSVQAQKFSLGVKAGPLVSRSVIADKFDRKDFSQRFKFGYLGAALITFPLKNDYTFETEAGFSQRGRKILSNNDSWTNIATYYYADFSMLLRRSFPFQLRKNVPSRWFINVGPHISYLIDGKGKIGVNTLENYRIVFQAMPIEPPDGQPDFDVMYYSDVNRWYFGIDLGFGFEAPLKRNQKILTELRFTSGHTFYGNTNSAQFRTLGFADNMRANEKVLSLTAAYIFDFNVQESRKGKSTKDKEVKRKSVKKRR